MIRGPNLASRPFLNTRPAWLVTAAAGLLTVAMVTVLSVSYLRGNQTLAERLADRDALRVRHDEVATALQVEAAKLKDVPWKSLESRINATNSILRERAFSWLMMLDDLEEVLPYDVRVTRIAPKVDGNTVMLGLEVTSRSWDALLEMLDTMLADPRFGLPSPNDVVLPERSNAAGYEMTLSVTYTPVEETP